MLKWEDKKRLAKRMGISVGFVNDILTRRKACPVKRAHNMAKCYHELFGVYVNFWEFTFNMVSTSPIFSAVDYKVLKQIEESLYGNSKPRAEAEPA